MFFRRVRFGEAEKILAWFPLGSQRAMSKRRRILRCRFSSATQSTLAARIVHRRQHPKSDINIDDTGPTSKAVTLAHRVDHFS
jgi:hypothetical protein